MLNVWLGCPGVWFGGGFGAPGLGKSRGFLASLFGTGGGGGLLGCVGGWVAGGFVLGTGGTGAC